MKMVLQAEETVCAKLEGETALHIERTLLSRVRHDLKLREGIS